MTLEEKQTALVARFQIIPDSHERLQCIVDRGKRMPRLDDQFKTDENRVEGCTSNVWLIHSFDSCVNSFQGEADSPIMQGFLSLLCELYGGAEASEVVDFKADLLTPLNLENQLTPTRRNGVHVIITRIQQHAHESLQSCR